MCSAILGSPVVPLVKKTVIGSLLSVFTHCMKESIETFVTDDFDNPTAFVTAVDFSFMWNTCESAIVTFYYVISHLNNYAYYTINLS